MQKFGFIAVSSPFPVLNNNFTTYALFFRQQSLNHVNCMMTSQIKSHIEYLTPTDNIILVLNLFSNLI